MKTHEIMEGLHIRGRLRWGDTGNVEQLALNGFGAVLTLSRPAHIPILNKDAVQQEHDIEYVHCPMSDGQTVNVDLVEYAATWVATQIRDGRKALVMCNAGRNRSGLIAALVLIDLYEVPASAAIEQVRHRRPRAIANPAFERWLLDR